MIIVILLVILLFLFYTYETFVNPQYPDILIFQNKKYWLLNSKKPLSAKNPINFSTIQEYKQYTKKKKYPILKVKTKNVPKFMLRLLVNSSKKPKSSKISLVSNKEFPIQKKPLPTRNKFFKQPNKKIYSKYGYSYMPATSWSVPQQRPPSCIPQKKCPVCPVVDKGTPVDAVEWSQVGSILPKFEYKEVYNPNYYYPGWISGDVNKLVKDYPKYNPQYSMQQPFQKIE